MPNHIPWPEDLAGLAAADADRRMLDRGPRSMGAR